MNTGQPVGCELFEFSEILILAEQNNQRVLHDLQRTRLSCGRMIQLLTHHLPPPLYRVWPVEVTDGRGVVEGVGEEPNDTTARKPDPL